MNGSFQQSFADTDLTNIDEITSQQSNLIFNFLDLYAVKSPIVKEVNFSANKPIFSLKQNILRMAGLVYRFYVSSCYYQNSRS